MWLSFVLVFFIGFAAHRVSLCTVRAVMQWMEQRKSGLLVSFFYASLWASLATGLFAWAGVPIAGRPVLASSLLFSVVGGLLFGMGAAVNGGCSLSTLQRLADGETRLFTTLVFFVVGSLVVTWLQSLGTVPWPHVEALWWNAIGPGIRTVLMLILLVWAVWQLAVLWRCRDRQQRPGQWLLAPRYRLSLAAMVLGLCSGLLFLLEGAWTYTNFLRELGVSWVTGTNLPGGHRLALVGCLFAGMVVSSVHRGQFEWRIKQSMFSWRNMLGGGLMGIGGALVPGGNDTVLLVLMPTLSLQALASFGAMLLGIYGVVKLMKVNSHA
ncbi:MAG: hypothetical protein CVU21_13275 [Betaproteobacteria bacterium HGW-Betaproteobacteria-15]|nr:MAG: hypothetical protein CVU21_13275 [Betaproteobacteria bacterium HGW-Betaproteobacteria-15]